MGFIGSFQVCEDLVEYSFLYPTIFVERKNYMPLKFLEKLDAYSVDT